MYFTDKWLVECHSTNLIEEALEPFHVLVNPESYCRFGTRSVTMWLWQMGHMPWRFCFSSTHIDVLQCNSSWTSFRQIRNSFSFNFTISICNFVTNEGHSLAPTITSLLLPRWTIECSLPAAWKTIRKLIVASSVKVFQRRPFNSGLILPRAGHLDSCMMASHQYITSHSWCETTPWLCSAYMPSSTSNISMKNHAHTTTVTNLSAFHGQL